MLSTLGGDDDDTIGTTRAIDGRGRHILQHLDRLDVGRINRSQRIEIGASHTVAGIGGRTAIVEQHTVDDIQRLIAGIDGVTATDADIDRCTWLTR